MLSTSMRRGTTGAAITSAGFFLMTGAFPVCSAPAFPPELADYGWRARLGGSMESNGVYRARLPSEVFDGCRAFPLDVKVVDVEGRVFPSMVWAQEARELVEPVRVSLPGAPERNDGKGYHAVRLSVESPPGATAIHNRVIVNIGGSEFLRRAEVWGGEAAEDLDLLGAGFLVEQKLPFALRQRSIAYADSSARVVEVRVFDDASDPGATLRWRATELVRMKDEFDGAEPVSLERADAPADETPRDGVASFYFEGRARNRPLMFIELESNLEEAALPVRFYGRNEATNSWRWIADGTLQDVGGFRQNRIALPKSDFRQLKVDAYFVGGKAPRMRLATAGAVPHHLLFRALSGGKAYLYFGSDRYQLPAPEFSARAGPALMAQAEEVEVSDRQANPLRVADSLDQYGRMLLKFGLGIFALLVTIVTVRIVRRKFED